MLRKICFTLLVVFSTLGCNISAIILDVDQIQQEMTNWCWAATSQSVLRYYGFDFTQTQIAVYGTDGANEWNWLYGSTENPTRRGIDLILYNFGNIETISYERSFSFAEGENEINHSKPLFVRWGWNSGGGHFVVLKGLEDDTAYLMDPWYGATINSYSWVLSGGGHTWTHSLQMQSAPVSNDDAIEVSQTLRCYPNPFTHTTKVEYRDTNSSKASFYIYNIKGQLVKECSTSSAFNGKVTFEWDGTNTNGIHVVPGIYILKAYAGGNSSTTKLILMK